MAMRVESSQPNRKAGLSIVEWCEIVGFSRPTFYRLTGPLKPRMAAIRGRQIVVESPEEYLERVASQQAQTARG